MTNKTNVLSTKDLSFKDILTYPDLSIQEGEMVFIEGASGAGKSSLLKLFNYTLTPTAGEIHYRGEPTSKMDTIWLRKNLLLVSQAVFLFEGSIADNFNLFYDYRDEPRLSDEEKAHYLELARVPFDLSALCQTMSGGERQRVYLAICLSFRPDVLMLDEPTSALDNDTSRELFDNIRQFAKHHGVTVIVISHNQALIRDYADRVITVEKEG